MKVVASRKFDKQIRIVLLSLLVNSRAVSAVAVSHGALVHAIPRVFQDQISRPAFPILHLTRVSMVSQRKSGTWQMHATNSWLSI